MSGAIGADQRLRAAIVRHFAAPITTGDDGRALATLANRRIALDLVDLGHGFSARAGLKNPRLRFDRVVLGPAARLRDALDESIPPNRARPTGGARPLESGFGRRELMTDRSAFIYVTYIRTTPKRLFEALTTPSFIEQYWLGVRAEADWREGGAWKLLFADGRIADVGEIVAFDPPRRLAIRWRHELMADLKAEGDSLCVFEIEPKGEAAKLTVTHSIDRSPSKLIEAVSGGWPQILSNLKSLIETGAVVVTR